MLRVAWQKKYWGLTLKRLTYLLEVSSFHSRISSNTLTASMFFCCFYYLFYPGRYLLRQESTKSQNHKTCESTISEENRIRQLHAQQEHNSTTYNKNWTIGTINRKTPKKLRQINIINVVENMNTHCECTDL